MRPRARGWTYHRVVADGEHGRPPGRVAALSALLIDWVALLLMLIAAMVLALAWLLLSTRAGRFDASPTSARASA